jgi:hypothetical protein
MESRKEEQKPATPVTEPKEKKRRFQIVKLEERIAPSKGGHGTHNCGSHVRTC